MNTQFILIDYGGETYGELPWIGFYKLENAYPIYILGNRRSIKSSILQKIRRVHLSFKLNNIFNLPFKYIWSNANSVLKTMEWDSGTNYYLIFGDNDIYPIDYRLINKIKKEQNLHLILFAFDSWDSATAFQARKYSKKVQFDYIFTFDPVDAAKYNFIFYCVPYVSDFNNINVDIKYDLSFIGYGGNRLKRLLDFFGEMRQNAIRPYFRISGVKKDNRKYTDEIIYGDSIPYDDVKEIAKSSNCILEIPIDGQCGESIRYYEAVCYNKKLLTTNEHVKDFPFYNPKYIKVFKNPKEIDWDWVKKREPIDYKYDGSFEPQNFLDKILELEEKRKSDG